MVTPCSFNLRTLSQSICLSSISTPAVGSSKTSMGGFYYVHQKRGDKMLEKVKAERERLHSLKVNEAMLVSKYASKFQINVKDMIK